MSISLILFFASLLSIIFMIGRKLLVIPQGAVLVEQRSLPEFTYLKEVQEATVQSAKKYGYRGLVVGLRWYMLGINFLKNKYENIKAKIRARALASDNDKKEISKFLKIITEYKQKIREIKHRIRKEENL